MKTLDDVKLVTYPPKNNPLASVHAVVSNDDLLIEILLRLPITSLCMFKPVSKRWLSLITDTKFLERRKINKVDSPSGLFLPREGERFNGYDFLPFDTASSIQSFTGVSQKLVITQSCNGLLLCFTWAGELYVCNPCLKMFKVLPDPFRFSDGSYPKTCKCNVKMAFDPTKSPHYKIIHAVRIEQDSDDEIEQEGDDEIEQEGDDEIEPFIRIEMYSSETCSVTVCEDRIPFDTFACFENGIYWDGGIHWLNIENNQCVHLKLDIEELDVLTMAPTPATVGCVPQLFESHGCLLLSCRNGFDSSHFNIYEKRNGYSEWLLKYVVSLDEAMLPLSKTLGMPINWRVSSVLSIVLEEKEQDSFMVIKIADTVVQYKFTSKTIRTLCHYNKSWDSCGIFQFIASFSGERFHELSRYLL